MQKFRAAHSAERVQQAVDGKLGCLSAQADDRCAARANVPRCDVATHAWNQRERLVVSRSLSADRQSDVHHETLLEVSRGDFAMEL